MAGKVARVLHSAAMAAPFIDPRDVRFLLYDVLEAEALADRPRYAEHGRATFDAALEVAHDLARDAFLNHNRASDEREPHLENGAVAIIPQVKAAIDAFAGAGFLSAHMDETEGGQQLPWLLSVACMAHFQAANVATVAYPFLTMAAANCIAAFGTPAQKARYMRPMLAGRFYGTMMLTEPQAGSSLSDIRTRATPAPGGLYHLDGDKIFISGGDHEMAENIVHLVLARMAGAPAGAKGLSLFIVPRRHVGADGASGARNGVSLAGLIHKMGYRGTVSTMIKFGETAPCVGELLGPPHQGLGCMFHMMNEARIGVGMGAAMLGYAGYLASLDYARTRTQGRPASEKNPEKPQVPLIQHADIRRMLLAQKSYVEGAFALGLYCARLVDDKATGPTPKAREEAGLLLEILTPVIKAWPSDWCLEANRLAIQIHGGYGYTRDFPVEQHYRDNRLNPIHEGTNGIQALDLLGRKAFIADGAAFELLVREMTVTAMTASLRPALTEYGVALATAVSDWRATTEALGAARVKGQIDLFLANAAVYLDMTGHLAVAWMWLKQALAADAGLANGAADEAADFYRGKLQACRYFFRWELPKGKAQGELLRALDDTCFSANETMF